MQSIGFVSQRQPDAVEQLKAIWRACFDAEEEYLHLYFSTRYRPDQTLVLEEDGQILGMLTLLPCTLRALCQGEWRLYRASYLFAVGTLPQAQGRQIATQLLQFADKYAGEFVRWLEKDGFFENGLLVITGDHRAMLPVSQQQYDTLGPDAESHIPLVIMGAGLKGRRTVKGSHTDLGASLEYLTLPQACFHQFQHNLFSPASKRNSCTLFQTLTLEKKALADCGGTFISFRLLPGSNKIFHGKLPAEQAAELMAFMSWLRENNTY